MSGVSITGAKLAWADSVALDAQVSPAAFRLAWVLVSKFYNPNEGAAWPTEAKLAELLDTSDRQVRRWLAELVAAKHVRVSRGGRGKSNRYHFSFDDRTPLSSKEGDPASISSDLRTCSGTLNGRQCPTNPLKEPESPPSSQVVPEAVRSREQDSDDDELFSKAQQRWRAARQKFPKACPDSSRPLSVATGAN